MVRTLSIVGQHAAGQGQVGFRSRAGVAVVHGFRQVIDDVHVQVAVGGGAVVVGGDHCELFANAVGAVGVWMGFVVQQGVAVADHARGGVVASDGQRIAECGGNRLWETGCHATRHHIDAANTQGLHTVQRSHGERAALSQRRCIRAAAIAEVFLLQ